MSATLNYAPALLDKLAARGNDIPAWLPLGWISVESGGNVGDNDTTVSSLGGEQGLFQLSADERSTTGFTDSARILSDPDYSLDAGLALIDYYGNAVTNAGVDPSQGDSHWYLVKFAHGIGSGAMRILVNGWLAQGGDATSWDDFEAYASVNPYQSQSHTELWTGNADRVHDQGVALAALAGVTSAVAATGIPNPGTTVMVVGAGLALAAGYYLFLQGGS